MRGDGKQLATILEGAGEEEEEEGEMGREIAYTSESERYSQCAISVHSMSIYWPLPSLSTTSSSASSFDFESDEYFDVDSELQLDRGVAENVVPSVVVHRDDPPDVEEDELFHDTDDNASKGWGLVYHKWYQAYFCNQQPMNYCTYQIPIVENYVSTGGIFIELRTP